MTVIVYRSKSASYAAQRVANASNGAIRAVQENNYRPRDGDSMVVRWDCYADLSIPTGVLDLNRAAAVVQARDKGASRRVLAELAPPTWFDRADVQVPCVVRPRTHKAGNKFYVCKNHLEVATAVWHCGTGWYASRLIDKAREFRVFVVQGRVAAVSERFQGIDHAVAWNLALGGRLRNLNRPDWPVDVLRAALTAMERVGLGFGAVDACIDTARRVWIFELNTSPALRNKFTIAQIAKALSSPLADSPPVREGAQKPRSYAHPAVLTRETSPAAAGDTVAVEPASPAPQTQEPQPMPLPTPSPIQTDISELRVLTSPIGRTIGWIIDQAQERGVSHFQFNGDIYDARTLQVVYRRAVSAV